MNDDYAALTPIYDRIGLSRFAEAITPQLIGYAQSNDWVGRRVIDLGCGSGGSVRWLARHGYNVTGVDLSPAMLSLAQKSIQTEGLGLRWLQGDIRAITDLHDLDLALAVDTLNELNSLRDLETVFGAVLKVLNPGKLFVFDLHTLEGLAERGRVTEFVLDDDDLTVVDTHHFDYERQASVSEYRIFERSGDLWRRWNAARTRRGFPIQVVTALLVRSGFGIMTTMNERLQPLNVAAGHVNRVIFFAQKPETE